MNVEFTGAVPVCPNDREHINREVREKSVAADDIYTIWVFCHECQTPYNVKITK